MSTAAFPKNKLHVLTNRICIRSFLTVFLIVDSYQITEKLVDHPIPTVREWAHSQINNLENQIKYERDKDIDGIF